GLLSPQGQPLDLQLQETDGSAKALGQQAVLVLTEAEQSFTFMNVAQLPVVSLLRGFSAPVVLETELDDGALFTLLSHDTDPFNRWEAAQTLALRRMLSAVKGQGDGGVLDSAFIEALRGVLRHPELDAAFKDLVLTLPSEGHVAEQLAEGDPQRIHEIRESFKLQLAAALREDLAWAFEAYQDQGGYQPDATSMGRRSLVNLALGYLCLDDAARREAQWLAQAEQRFHAATNMTDRLGALSALLAAHAPQAQPCLDAFHALYKDEELVIDKWFALQAGTPEHQGQVFARVKALMLHPDFTLRTPNRARSLLAVLCQNNPAAFHRQDAAGYVFWADRVIEIDTINPQLAARLARALDHWRRLAEPYRSAA